MKNIKQMGVWMDHSNALLMELEDDTIATKRIVIESTYQEKKPSGIFHEKLVHSKEQQQQSDFYKKIGDSVKNYQEVVLFGPTEAKNELLNLLKADHLFDKIKIEVKDTDKMTENQIHAFVKEYFI